MYLKRVTRGISLSFVLIIAGALLAYFFRRLLATELSIEDYGMFYALLSFFGFFMLFIDLGIEQAATKKIVELIEEKKKDEIPKLARTILIGQVLMSLFFFILFFLTKNIIAEQYFHNPNTASFLWILSVWFLTAPLVTFCAYILLGFQRTTWYTALDTARMTIVLIICMIGFQYNTSLYIPTIAYAAINFLLFAGTYPYLKSFVKELEFFSVRRWREMNLGAGMEIMKYAIPIAFTNFGWIILTQTDTVALTYFTSLREVGLYNIALPISLLLLFFMRPVIIVFAPLVAELHKGKKTEKLSEAVKITYTYLFVLLVPCALSIILFPEYMIVILFNEKYVAAATALKILTLGTIFYAFSLFNNILYTGMGQAKKIAKSVATICGLNLVLNILFVGIFHGSIIGAALATTICYILLFVTSTYELKKYISFSFPWKMWTCATIAGIIAGGISFLVQKRVGEGIMMKIFSGEIVLIGIYLGGIYMLQIVRKKEIMEILKKLRESETKN